MVLFIVVEMVSKEPRFQGLLDAIRLRLHLLASEMRAVGVNDVLHMPLRSVNRVRIVLSRILVRLSSTRDV